MHEKGSRTIGSRWRFTARIGFRVGVNDRRRSLTEGTHDEQGNESGSPRVKARPLFRDGAVPLEDEAEYEKHRRAVFDEYKPNGPSELDTIDELSSLFWRKKHLLIYKLAANVRLKRSSFLAHEEFSSPFHLLTPGERLHTPEEMRELDKKATERAKTELGAWLELVDIGEVATTEYLLQELDIIERSME